VRSRETSESEPSMNCRKRIIDVKTGDGGHLGINAGGVLKTGPRGVRLEGGVNLDQARIWNVGTCCSDAKGETQAGNPRKGESTNAERRDGAVRSRVEGAVMALDRRDCGIQLWRGVNR
jgi:hypothetical protein